jgi:3-oxoacyl-[acyl-carrier-protein] synthase II
VNRVVITGLGLITPIGNNPNEFWFNLTQGNSGVSIIDRFDSSAFTTRIAAQIRDFVPQDYLPRTEARRMDRFAQFACGAARLALEDAKLQITPQLALRSGVWIGSGIGGIETIEKQHDALQSRGLSGVSPFFIPMLIPNMAAGQVAIQLGLKGPSACTVTACASGTNSIGEAFNLIRLGKAEVMLAGGSEACITPLGIAGFCAMKAMSTRNDDPQGACRPFDQQRDGFVMGEGAGIIVLEEFEHARQRGAVIYGEILGYGSSTDAVHMVQPDSTGRGAVAAMQEAIRDAGIKPQEIDYINAHGTGTRLNDLVETIAIKDVFGDYSYRLPVSSIKPCTGHMLGAAGAVEAIACLLAMQQGEIPPTANLQDPDPECDLDYVPQSARTAQLNTVLSQSLGFGGHNAVLIMRRLQNV